MLIDENAVEFVYSIQRKTDNFFMFKTLLASQCVVVIIVTLLEAVATVDVITACNNDLKLGETRTVHFA